MIHAYSEIYLDDAMNTLAEVFSYTPDARQADVICHPRHCSMKSLVIPCRLFIREEWEEAHNIGVDMF